MHRSSDRYHFDELSGSPNDPNLLHMEYMDISSLTTTNHEPNVIQRKSHLLICRNPHF